jgi:AraC-like DNA-binding protein
MISGSRNLAYLSRGMRTYGSRPIIERARGRWEFEFIFKGRARPTGVECAILEEGKPRVYVFHPDSPHGWTDDDDGVSEVFVVQFNEVPEELDERISPTKPIMLILGDADRRRMAARLQDVWNDAGIRSVRTSLKLHQLLLDMVMLVVGEQEVGGGRTGPADKISRAIHWFEENIGEQPTVEDAARAVGVSAAHLRRLFASAGRPSPQAELTRIRMEAAQRCLVAGWKQEAISQFLGFSEVSAFARAFRNDCGSAPRRWLKENQRRGGEVGGVD